MAWTIKIEKNAKKELKKLDFYWQKKITTYLIEEVLLCSSLRALGKPLSESLKKLWRYRVGKFRIICEIQDQELIILVLVIKHRSDVYK